MPWRFDRPEFARTCCDYSGMLIERNDEDDRAKAIAMLDESLAISSEMGMRAADGAGTVPVGDTQGVADHNGHDYR